MTQITTWAIIGLMALLLGSSAYAYVEREKRIAAVERADKAEAAAEQRQQQITQLNAELAAARERAAFYGRVRRNVVAATNSNACMASEPVGVALDGLRSRASGGSGRTDQPPTSPPDPLGR